MCILNNKDEMIKDKETAGSALRVSIGFSDGRLSNEAVYT